MFLEKENTNSQNIGLIEFFQRLMVLIYIGCCSGIYYIYYQIWACLKKKRKKTCKLFELPLASTSYRLQTLLSQGRSCHSDICLTALPMQHFSHLYFVYSRAKLYKVNVLGYCVAVNLKVYILVNENSMRAWGYMPFECLWGMVCVACEPPLFIIGFMLARKLS